MFGAFLNTLRSKEHHQVYNASYTFTPNGDNYNDTFLIIGQSASDIEYLAIYNRWGTRIFEANNNTSWSGENCPDGVYTIMIFLNNKRFVKSLALVR